MLLSAVEMQTTRLRVFGSGQGGTRCDEICEETPGDSRKCLDSVCAHIGLIVQLCICVAILMEHDEQIS